MTEKVTLVGAGPGSRWLLTLRGAAALAEAEAVVYDRLVSADILSMIPADAERIDVGKRDRSHPVPQHEINEILVRLAQAGKRTVRLKGGDCYLFGRGGEECEYLHAHGVPFEVVPGVTSALAAPAFAGIPVTHRDFCSSVHLITAHARAGGALEIDYDALVRLQGTLVFLMGLSALERVTGGLLEAGMPPETPAAVIENGARGVQRKVVDTVGGLAEAVRQAGLGSPALIVVGTVCALHETLDWFTPLPLHGRTVAVTRPRERAGTLAERLRRLGADVIECPCIETHPVDDLSMLKQALTERWDWVVLTSPAGVPAMLDGLNRLGRDLRALYGCRFAVIGQGTADALARAGIRADLMPERYDGAHLGARLAAAAQPGERILLLRAREGSPELSRALEEAGLSFADVPVYETVYPSDAAAPVRERLAAGEPLTVTFTSASTVTGFLQSVGDCDLSGVTALCIGEQTAARAREAGLHSIVAKNATIDNMIDRLLEES